MGCTWDLTWWTYIRMGVLANHLGSSNHFVFSSRNFRQSLVFTPLYKLVGFQVIKCCRHPKGTWLYFCTNYSIEANAAQPAISDSCSVLQKQERKQPRPGGTPRKRKLTS